ncbi:MAG TPA: energy transducer TonB [Pseudolabrys sp.]|nr:energy transducer TonB [Pseudolabrys sp.]
MPDSEDIRVNARTDTTASPPRRDALRWAICLAFAFGLHAAGAWAFLLWDETPDAVASAPVIMVELAQVAVSPEIAPARLPPGPEQPEVQPVPESHAKTEIVKPELDLEDKGELVASQPAPAEKPNETKQRQRRTRIATAPGAAHQRAPRTMSDFPGSPTADPNAVPNWKSALVARLERYKRYPADAQMRDEHGVAQLAFSVDRSGSVHRPHIVRSSGSSALDRETIALAERASPMPPPPPEVAGAQIPIVVPIRYNAR